jgi:hypothetical protein
MTFLIMGQGVSEGGSGSKSKEEGLAKSQPGNDGRAEIKMYIDAFYTSDFLHGYFK